MELDFFKTRRSVRAFSDRELSVESVDLMLEAAAQAPNTGNMQTVCAIVSSSTDDKAALAPTHFNQPCVRGCAHLVTFCADFNRFEQWCRQRGAEPGFDNLQSLMAGVIDASIFAQQFCTIAEMQGLGTVYLGTTLYNAADIARILELPSRVVPVITVAVGYPADTAPAGPTERLAANAVVHHGKYQPFSAEDIDAVYTPLEQLPQMQRFVADNAKPSLAHVFTEVRYPKATSDAFSATLSEFLKDFIR